MIKIGIIGEHPLNDSDAIKALLESSKRYEKLDLNLRIILKRMRGGDLDGKNGTPSKKAIKLLQQEFKDHHFDFIIYIRDLDGLPSEKKKIEQRKKWFQLFDKLGGNKNCIFLLAIYELEALILADIKSFNQIYKSNIKFTSHPMHKEEPKEFLKNATRKNNKPYKQSDCKELFGQLDFNQILEKHKGKNSFKAFILELDEKVGYKK